MATKIVDADGAVRAVFTAADGDANPVRMGPVLGGKAWAQIAVDADVLQGSNDGTNYVTVGAATGDNGMVIIDPLPLFIRSPDANTGGIIVVGWQDR